jgi:thiol:disulfide interchange protein
VKAFSLVQHSQSAPREVRLQGVAYAAGVLISFAAMALVLIGVRAAGAEIGWGFQLQSPLFVALMIYFCSQLASASRACSALASG